MRTAPEMIAASSKRNRQRQHQLIRRRDTPAPGPARDSRCSNTMSGAASTADERHHGAETDDLSDDADHHQSQQQHELPLAAFAQVTPQANQQRGAMARQFHCRLGLPRLQSRCRPDSSRLRFPRPVSAPDVVRKRQEHAEDHSKHAAGQHHERPSRPDASFGNNCRIDHRERVLLPARSRACGSSFRSLSGCTSHAESRLRWSLQSGRSGT